MTRRITIADVREVYSIYVKHCHQAGFHTAGFELHQGSKTYGRAYRSYVDGRGTPGTDTSGYLGMTAREAYDTLNTIICTLWDVAELKSGNARPCRCSGMEFIYNKWVFTGRCSCKTLPDWHEPDALFVQTEPEDD